MQLRRTFSSALLLLVLAPWPTTALRLVCSASMAGGTCVDALTITETDGTPSGSFGTLKFSNGSVTDNGDGSATVTTGVGGGGDASTNTSASVENELTLFSGVGGKTLKRATTTGLLKGTSGVLSAAVAGTDYVTPGGTVATATALASSPLPCSAGTVVTAMAATGTLTCDQVSLTVGVTGILPGANGGTGNGFVAFAGPATSLKTFTLPNASAVMLTDQTAVTVAQGGTGAASLTGVVVGTGTTPLAAVTTSGDLASALTDEVGSSGGGLLVFHQSPTLLTPIIASFANAAHTHTNAAGAGQLTDAALSAPVGITKGGTGTASTLTGLVRGSASAMTAAELSGDVTTSGSNATTIANNVVTLAKMATMATDSFLGRDTAGTGNVEVLSVATAKTLLALTGTNSGDQTITLTSDVTGTGTGSFATTIAANAVSYAKLQDVSAASRLLGRGDSGAGDPQEITLGAGLTMTGTTLSASTGSGTVSSGTAGRVAYYTGATTVDDSTGLLLDATSITKRVENVTASSSSITLGTHNVIACDATAAARTYTLPAASGQTLGQLYRVIKVDSSANACTLLPASGERLNGTVDGPKATTTQFEDLEVLLVSTATPNWHASGSLLGSSLAYIGVANTWGDGITQTFNPNATSAGLNVGSQAGDPSTPANGDLWYDSTGNLLRARINGASVSLGAGGGGVGATGTPVDNQVAVFTNATTVEGATPMTYTAGALTLGVDATTSGGLKLANGTAGGDTVTMQNISTTAGAWNFNLPATAGNSGEVLASGGGAAAPMTWVAAATASSTLTFTNKTLNVEDTGNVVTTVTKVWLPAASCQGTTASLLWDTKTTAFPVAACATNHGVADYATDSGTLAMHTTVLLPDDWTGALGGKVLWLSATTANNVAWQVELLCVADDEVDSSTFAVTTEIADTTKASTNELNATALTTLTSTGCAAGEVLHVQVRRDPADAQDTFAAGTTARFYGLELTMRRAQ